MYEWNFSTTNRIANASLSSCEKRFSAGVRLPDTKLMGRSDPSSIVWETLPLSHNGMHYRLPVKACCCHSGLAVKSVLVNP